MSVRKSSQCIFLAWAGRHLDDEEDACPRGMFVVRAASAASAKRVIVKQIADTRYSVIVRELPAKGTIVAENWTGKWTRKD